MKFAKLSKTAKERAREKWREHELDYDWWEDTYADAMTMGALFGCQVDDNTARTVGGQHISDPDIQFQGFSSQGDGACWSGCLYTDKLAGAVERVKAEAPQDEELHRLAGLAEALHGMIAAVQVANRLTTDPEARAWPEVEVGMTLTVTGHESSYRTRVDGDDVSADIEKAANELVGDFAIWIYRQLEAEYEYRLDDAQIDESIRSRDPDFDKDGNIK